ncbi:MAG: hypothetical protein H6799_02015 [Candidatus Nomurabacteria bacterium]|nr:MAG: hypothetical protein H6799_02015 [Candidatus Nomurabacteria bacterium]HRV76056.1 hypothetical protein [Candidatus Saccharimonadales bacterium]
MTHTPLEGCYSCESANETKGLVLSTPRHRLVIVQDQLYLGRAALIAQRHVPLMSDLTISEEVDWRAILKRYERVCIEVFGATYLTEATLMNNAYAKPEPKPHFHSHLRPRYSKPVEFAGVMFEDPNFGQHHLHGPENVRVVGDEVVEEIASAVRANWA